MIEYSRPQKTAFRDWLDDRDLEKRDKEAEAQYDLEERLEKEITFDEILEESVYVSDEIKKDFMSALARANKYDMHYIHSTLNYLKTSVLLKKLNGEML